MVVQDVSRIRATALRMSAFSLANICSIGVQVGAVGRQAKDTGAYCSDGVLSANNLARGQIVRHHDVAE